jgi:glycosyltransferase involved in cell wall biosynthesis
MPARILILRSNPVHSDPRVDKIASTLGESGYDVQVLGWDYTGSYPTEETRPGYHLRRISYPVQFGRGLANLAHELGWQRRLFGWLMRHRGTFDILHACDFDTVLPALAIRRFYGKLLVYDIFDFYADMLRQTPGPVKAAIRRIDLWAINYADAVILADDSRVEQITGSRPRRCIVVYNSPPDQVSPDSSAISSPPGSLNIAYIGLLQRERGLFELLEVLKLHTEWHLDLGGSGSEEQALQQIAGGLSNVHLHKRLLHEQALALNAAADTLIATFDPAIPNHRYSSSNKLFEAMMLGKPILVARHTNMDRLVDAWQCGLVVEYGDLDSLALALGHLAEDPNLRRRLGQNARQAYEQQFNWKLMQARLLELYQSLAGA